ncbi:MAG: hypothetical protein Q9188_006711 [Gyalolechia gomerana]
MSIAPSDPTVSAPFTVPPKGDTVSAAEEGECAERGNSGVEELEELVKELKGIVRMVLAMMREKEGEKEGGEDMVVGGEEGQKE